MTAEDISLDADKKYNDEVRKMLEKHETLWAGELGEICITEHCIDLIPDVKPFKSQPYRPGPKTEELKQFKLENQLKAGVTEPAFMECVAPILFSSKGMVSCASASTIASLIR